MKAITSQIKVTFLQSLSDLSCLAVRALLSGNDLLTQVPPQIHRSLDRFALSLVCADVMHAHCVAWRRFGKCDVCGGMRYGDGLRAIRPVTKIFGVRLLPFLFRACSSDCHRSFLSGGRQQETLLEQLYASDDSEDEGAEQEEQLNTESDEVAPVDDDQPGRVVSAGKLDPSGSVIQVVSSINSPSFDDTSP